MKKNLVKISWLIIMMIFSVTILEERMEYIISIKNSNINQVETLSNDDMNNEEILINDDIEYLDTVSTASKLEHQKSDITQEEYNIEPHIDEVTNIKYITYEDFNAKGNEEEDDYNAIKKTHEVANKNGYEVRAEEGKTYHIYKFEDTGTININTNTDWNNANIIIHDENIKDYATKKYPIISITDDETNINIPSSTVSELVINRETKKIPQLAGYGNCYVIIYNFDKTQYIRTGNTTGTYQLECFKIDNDGNVLNEIQWDYEKISKVVLRKIPSESITIKNANFKTILDSEGEQEISGYLSRNIECTRSNVTIKNINHSVNDNNQTGGPYFGFIRVKFAADINIENCELVSYQCKEKRISNYDLTLESSINITLDGITSNDIMDSKRWGITASNYTKDVTYKNCKLNRIDAHNGIHNLNIDNCIIGVHGVTVVGSGNLNISNTVNYCKDCFIYLRTDLGSTWDGNINITNCIYKNVINPKIIGFQIYYDNGEPHDYGYKLFLPNVNIDGLKIEDEDMSDYYEKIYMFYNSEYITGIDNGDIRNNYILPKKITIKNYQTSSGKKLKIFYNKFYDNLEELGINLSMPISDKEEVQITNEKGDNVEDNTITNENIKISYQEVEGIETTVNVNNEKINENKKNLDTDGIYNISITYKNTEGETEIVSKQVTIDKTAPVITGIEQGKTYKNKVIPKVNDENLQKVELLLNGQLVEGYKINSEITDEGIYELIATDKAGNIKNINFQIIEPAENDYKIENDKIINISYNTEKKDFDEKLAIGEKYIIKRGNKTLTENEKIATGDILETTEGKEYKLIVTGDINSDGDVNIKDIIKLRKYLLLRNNLNETEILAADTNLDGKDISIKDLVRMRIIVLTKE